jgi:UDP-N-acetylglucosamine:LPS N-acetylglucosamine transferase
MSEAARRLARPDAARVIADKALELADACARHSATDTEK